MLATRTVCGYCRNPFQPEIGDNGEVYDLDNRDQPCCDDCFCANCDHGHAPDEDCPRDDNALQRAVAEEYEAYYGDPDAAYDRFLEPCLLDT